MKKPLFLVCALLSFAFTVSAQETTWINPTVPTPIPRSMMLSVSSVILYDEIDVIFLSPAELSNYSGITFFTAYGNYEYDWISGAGVEFSGITAPINPLTTNNPAQGTDIGRFLFGVGSLVQTQADLRGLLAGALLEAPAVDAATLRNSMLAFGLSGNVDPVLPLGSMMRLKTRAALSYAIGFGGYSVPRMKSISYTEQNAVSATPSAYSYEYAYTSPLSAIRHDISLEAGGLVEFKDPKGFLTVGAGLFCDPVFSFLFVSRPDSIETTRLSWTDITNTDPQAVGLTDIGPGIAQGTRTDTVTTTYGENRSSTLGSRFYLPVSARLSLVKDALSLIGGYILSFQLTSVSETSSTGYDVTVTTVADTSGANVYTSPASADSTGFTTTTTVNTEWNGSMNFMIRWSPVPGLTVDFFGQSIMNTLNFQVTLFNPQLFVSTPGMSVTLKM